MQRREFLSRIMGVAGVVVLHSFFVPAGNSARLLPSGEKPLQGREANLFTWLGKKKKAQVYTPAQSEVNRM